VLEKRLRQVLCVLCAITTPPQIRIDGRPINAAQLGQGRLSTFARFFPSGQNDTPGCFFKALRAKARIADCAHLAFLPVAWKIGELNAWRRYTIPSFIRPASLIMFWFQGGFQTNLDFHGGESVSPTRRISEEQDM
jgi:hypothetical protein